ncbi:MAG TPA: hypothetical protein VKT52_03015, partial [Ktedonobacterales bacterium]|nr:hypothetical protein [Ktedonobacterales bacterium]
IQSWFNDFGGTSFENIDTQYYDNSGHITDTHTLGGVDFVSSAPPTDSTCTPSSTVEDSSLQSEVSSAIAAKGWPTDGSNAVYYVYLPNGDSLNDGGANGCSASGGGGYCAYHNWTGSVEYGAMPYPGSGCQVSTSPNGNVNGDSEVNLTSHEQAESITDPYPPGNGWIDAAGYEIGDKCAWDFSSGLTHMNNGGTFEVQTEYSNASHSCVNSYGTTPTPTPTTPPTPTPTPNPGGNNFSISASPSSLSIQQGSSGTSTISTAVTGGSAGAVSLSASVSPAGPTASLNPTSVTAGGSSTLTVSVGSTVATGSYTVTVTGNESGVTHSTSVSVSVTGSGGTTTQLLANPGFESGQSPWRESSSGGYQLVDPTNPHTGSYSAYLCGYDYCNDQIWQTVTLPSTTTKVVLSYWFYSDTSEAPGSPCYDYFRAKIRTSSGGTITTVQTKCNSNVTNGWVHYTFDITSALSSYHGQQIEVYFQGTNDVTLPSDFFVDDVALNVTH